MNEKYSSLFEPFTFKSGFRLDNRTIMAPMTTQSSFENGMVTIDEHLYYKRRATGVGMIITSCAQVMENGKFPGSLSAASDKHIESLSKLAESIKSCGTKAILQIFHVGRMGMSAAIGEQTVSASAIPAPRKDAETPRELSNEEVHEMVTAFGEATRRAIEAGFDGVEIHGANTYLIQQFFSPHSNRRNDEWGGTLEKRMRFPLAVVRSAKETIDSFAKKPFLFGYRISPEEIEEPGITLDDTLALMSQLKKEGLDYIHASVGDAQQSSIRNKESKEAVLAIIQEEMGHDFPLIGVGKIQTPDDALNTLELGIPLVAIGRGLLVEPDWIRKVKDGNESSIRTEITPKDYKDLCFPDSMWEYVQSRPGWLPFAESKPKR
ncbi:NADH-dependent flavin oxidoreductase [Halobacillus litoralis]|uniref:NADH-dependent flavin oxidoreductase n=1 Tax=Halobacillus litoralis TaxID=45668 RepID=A0A410M9X2_9BACI|nr:NADH-dependent flavin oxidoreductase [Halobacillus litoralis]QAS51470.1 NADH-dependent flavin oxidoreductase [Halobacillus litoralis]